jgi:hypothetical protein
MPPVGSVKRACSYECLRRRYRELVERLAHAVLMTTGETGVPLRQAVQARAAALRVCSVAM